MGMTANVLVAYKVLCNPIPRTLFEMAPTPVFLPGEVHG